MKRITALLLIILALCFVSCGREESAKDTDKEESTSGFETETEEIVSIIDWMDFIKYLGGTYVLAEYSPEIGAEVGKVEYSAITKNGNAATDIPEGAISASFCEIGTKIYECKGYSPIFRIAVNKYGTVYCYERKFSKNTAGVELFEAFPKADAIKNIRIGNVGEIDKAEDIESFVSYMQKAEFALEEEKSGNRSYRIEVCFKDGSRTVFNINNNMFCDFIGGITVDKGLFELIETNIFTEKDIRRGGIFRINYENNICSDHIWIANGVMQMGTNYYKSSVIAKNAKGNIILGDNEIIYLTEEGNIAKIRYIGEKNPYLKDNYDNRTELTHLFSEPEIVCEGNFIKFEICDGEYYKLSEEGSLYCGDEIILSGIEDFAVSGNGVIYSTENGLFLIDNDGNTLTLWEGRINDFSLNGFYVYYASGEHIAKIRVDGERHEILAEVSALSLTSCSGYAWYNYVITFVGEDGRGYFLTEDRELYTLDRELELFEIYDNICVILSEGELLFGRMTFDNNRNIQPDFHYVY